MVFLNGREIDFSYWQNEHQGLSDDFYWDLAHRRLYQAFISGYLTASDRVLDVGCGRGYFVAACRKEGIVADGIDVSSAVIDWATNQHGPWFQAMRIEELAATTPIPNYDIVTLWDVVEHLPNPLSVLRACHSVTRAPGRVFLQTPNVTFHLFYARIKRLTGFDRRRGTYLELPDHVCQFSSNTIRLLCQQSGFERVTFPTLPPVDSVAGRTSPFLAYLKRAYHHGSSWIRKLTGVNPSNSLQIIAYKPRH